ncbi:MAG: hypothetical protein AABM42_04540 [Actinomycetota bacterium]
MADQEQIPPKPETREDADEQGGVFGNLPPRRPAVRSPRRAEAAGPAAAGATPKAAGRQSRSAQPEPSVPRSPRGGPTRPPGHSPAAEHETPPPAGAEHSGVEDLAWAGIAVAAEAATLGVRLLSRAVEAVRKPADRR